VTFFMIVTPRDAVIADYAIRSYAHVRNLDFRLNVYSNYLLPDQKAYYFPRWQMLPFVDIAGNPHHDADIAAIGTRITDERLEGPFEYCDPIWDRELPTFSTPYVATVDADFEIIRSRFVDTMMRRLRREPDLVVMSTDYSPTDVVFEPYTGNTIILNERNHTWFCIYRHQAFEVSQVSHAFHREMLVGAPVERNCWDSCAYFQKSLRDAGLRLDHLHGKYSRDFIHYGAFSKNTTVTRESVAMFRRLAILENSMPRRLSGTFRRARTLVLPKLENNRYQWVREAPIRW
jgi:hypothetical protein